MGKKFLKHKILISLDMLISILSALFINIIFYKLGYTNNVNIAIIVLSIILLPLTMVVSLIIFKCYKKPVKNIDIKQFDKYIKAIFVSVVMYLSFDIIFRYYNMAICKFVSISIAGFLIIQMRMIYRKISVKDKRERNMNTEEKKIKKNKRFSKEKTYLEIESIEAIQNVENFLINTEELYEKAL